MAHVPSHTVSFSYTKPPLPSPVIWGQDPVTGIIQSNGSISKRQNPTSHTDDSRDLLCPFCKWLITNEFQQAKVNTEDSRTPGT